MTFRASTHHGVYNSTVTHRIDTHSIGSTQCVYDCIHTDCWVIVLWRTMLFMVGKKCGNWETPSQKMLVLGGEFWNLEGNCAIFNIKQLWEIQLASWEKYILKTFFPAMMLSSTFVHLWTPCGSTL